MGVTHTVVQGECLSSIAAAYGYAVTDWPIIYEHELNTEFRALRPDPNLIYPGDQVYIPGVEDAEPKTELVEAGRRHSFRLSGNTVTFELTLQDSSGAPHAGRTFELMVAGTHHQGVTTSAGLISVRVPTTATEGTLTLHAVDGTTQSWDLKIGHLDPVGQLSGVQARLNNLGFDAGPVDGLPGPQTEAGIKAFQAAEDLDVDGIAGPVTQGRLIEVYGC